ncbi:hypothetical protein X777_06833 [Ooceraea biroi]|uniref:Uncharacterized protein n=1 Tax=Ooceraea biroi TaxID=2015173 RepID=A0A026WDH9_OOCBI|nr:hypothetical protein X777_06833 [Ooceraea biroi]
MHQPAPFIVLPGSIEFARRSPASGLYLDSGDSGMYLKRPVGWWIGPPKRRVACGAR